MKSMLIIIAVLLGGYYVTVDKLVMAQLNSLKDFYSNIDQYSSSIADTQNSKDITTPQNLQTLQNPAQN